MRVAAILVPALLAACSAAEEAPQIVPERDPLAAQALGEQIMVDPDLSRQNEANAALTGGSDHSLPPIVSSPEAIAAARQEAADLVGGMANLRPPGQPERADAPLPDATLYAVTELAKLTRGTAACADRATFTAAWAASMPKALPIYPRGNTIEAAGSDSGNCRLRAVRFLTPVSREDVLAFYTAMARNSAIATSYRRAGDTDVLAGEQAQRRFAVYVRTGASGLSEVGLVTSGWRPEPLP